MFHVTLLINVPPIKSGILGKFPSLCGAGPFNPPASKDTAPSIGARTVQLALPLVPALKKGLGLQSLDSMDDTVDSTAAFTLQLGSDDLASIPTTAPSDRSSPTSAVGIEKFGVWAPDSGVVAVDPRHPLLAGTHRSPG